MTKQYLARVSALVLMVVLVLVSILVPLLIWVGSAKAGQSSYQPEFRFWWDVKDMVNSRTEMFVQRDMTKMYDLAAIFDKNVEKTITSTTESNGFFKVILLVQGNVRVSPQYEEWLAFQCDMDRDGVTTSEELERTLTIAKRVYMRQNQKQLPVKPAE